MFNRWAGAQAGAHATPMSRHLFQGSAPTRALTLSLVFGLASVAASAASAPLVPCEGTPAAPFLAAGAASQLVCKQSMLRSGVKASDSEMDSIGSQRAADGLTAALRGGDVLGVRDWHPYRSPSPDDGLLDFSQGKVVEQGSVGSPGELWWGRVSGGTHRCCSNRNPTVWPINPSPLFTVNESESLMLAIGQESTARRYQALTTVDQRMRHAVGLVAPWTDNPTVLHFKQHAAVATVSETTAPEAPGSITDATLDLVTADHLSGTLHFTLTISGQTSTVDIPLKRDVDEALAKRVPVGVPDNPHRLRQGRIDADGRIADCPRTRTYCLLQDQAEAGRARMPYPRYAARGMFFGGEGEYLAISFTAQVPHPTQNRLWGQFRGLLIMKRSQ